MSQEVMITTREPEDRVILFQTSDREDYRRRWRDIQSDFVDEPRKAVEEADVLVKEVIQRLNQVVSTERNGDASTEDLRQQLRKYRFSFDRLLTL